MSNSIIFNNICLTDNAKEIQTLLNFESSEEVDIFAQGTIEGILNYCVSTCDKQSFIESAQEYVFKINEFENNEFKVFIDNIIEGILNCCVSTCDKQSFIESTQEYVFKINEFKNNEFKVFIDNIIEEAWWLMPSGGRRTKAFELIEEAQGGKTIRYVNFGDNHENEIKIFENLSQDIDLYIDVDAVEEMLLYNRNLKCDELTFEHYSKAWLWDEERECDRYFHSGYIKITI